MAASRTPKEVVRRFLDHGRAPDGGWDMAVIDECFSEGYQLYRALSAPD